MDENNEWIKAIFQKHGHHIRHLYVHWELVLEAASLSTRSAVTEGRRGGCRNLLSLSAVDVMSYILLPKTVLGPMDLQLPWLPEDRKEVLLSEEYLNRRHLAGCFWLLVRQNPGLVDLILSRNGLLEYLPDEYNLETLSQLTQLKELYIGRSAFDIQMLLGALPRLEQLQCHGLEEVSILQQNYDCLRYLNYRGSVHLPKLLNILRQLPGLEELRLTGVVNQTLKTAAPASEVVAGSAPFPQLKEFRLDGPPLADDTLIALLVTLFPGLLKISMSKVPDATMKALWEHCFYLDSLHDFNKDDRISAWRERRAKDVRCN
ncbi:MAG: hypothetical protein J3R72DRAFT_491437 [Linnemannia gamsii]|nr:MAG: hypothetical protein J3R72DRAFT_491437 [Linnemannia gamsii]